MTLVSVLLFVTSKSTFINNEIMSPSMPNITQIINSKSIAYFVISNMPRNGPIAVPNTKLKENKLMPSLFLLTGNVCRNSTCCSCHNCSCDTVYETYKD